MELRKQTIASTKQRSVRKLNVIVSKHCHAATF